MTFKKNCRHTHQNPLKLSPVSERSANPCITMYAFPCSPLGQRVWPWIEAYCPKFQLRSVKMSGAQNAKRSTFQSTLARELLDAIHFPASSLGTSAAPQIFTLTPASYSHSTSTSLHSIGFINSFRFFFLIPRGYLQSTMQPHQRQVGWGCVLNLIGSKV